MKIVCLSLAGFLLFAGCSNSNLQSTMDEFIQINTTMSGSQTRAIVNMSCCVTSFKNDVKGLSLNKRLTDGGLSYAPYRFISENHGYDFKATKLKSQKQISDAKVEVTFGTDTHEIVGPMELENGKWLFCIGPVKVYKLVDGEKELIDSKLYTYGEEFD